MFEYRDGQLCADGLPLETLAAQYGTPLYVYSRDVLEKSYDNLEYAMDSLGLPYLICYALKANSNPVLGRLLAQRGAGVDVVSGGELYLARQMGFPGARIVFAGVGKTRAEMEEALSGAGIRAFHVESRPELETLSSVAAEMGKVAPVAVRVNPDVEAHTHPYITTGTAGNKFGVAPADALEMTRRAAADPYLQPVGLHTHIGSQLADIDPIIEATRRVLELWDTLAGEGIALRTLNIGGGLAIPYRPGDMPQGPAQLAAGLRPLLEGRNLELELEPGRYLLGPCGVLLTRVLYSKPADMPDSKPAEMPDSKPADMPDSHPANTPANATAGHARRLIVVDAGMNDLIRPALYGAYHPIRLAQEPYADAELVPTDIAGPVCESSDFLATERPLPDEAGEPGTLLVVGQAGAYGFAMTSQYNGRPRAAEVLVDSSVARVIRPRETYQDLLPHDMSPRERK
jgi:diaminopimelate decarboxylase